MNQFSMDRAFFYKKFSPAHQNDGEAPTLNASCDFEKLAQIIEFNEQRYYRINGKTPYHLFEKDWELLSPGKGEWRIDQGIVEISSQYQSGELAPSKAILLDFANKLGPWRKGPFRFFDILIDSEWRSDLKWQRLEQDLPQLKDKVVLDLGSNNGYFLYRLAEKGVAMAFGADPLGYCLAQFRFLNHFAQCRQVHLDLWGTEELPLFNQYFDFILFMGVIYHHKNPDQLLKNIHQALKPNGQMIIESITVNPSDLKAEVDENFVLKPKDRYASMRNVHFIPSKMALKNVLIKNGFRIIKEVFDVRLTSEEQRVTAWSRERSLENFLDPENPHLTIEGHPAPWRTAFLVQKIN